MPTKVFTSLEAKRARFDQAMFGIYRTAKTEARYNATFFLQMLTDQGGFLTAKRLINGDKPSDGYTALYERDRLDLTVEALLVDNQEWHELFTDAEIATAKARLLKYGYEPKN